MTNITVIGAGAVVTKDVSNHALILGNPAKITGWACECGNRLYFHNDVATCSSCKKQYKIFEDGIKFLEYNCDNNYEVHNEGNACIDGDKQSNYTYDKELTLPLEVDYCSIH